jgi:hypothetical protein
MKQILALVVAFTITTTAFSQAGQKWSTTGNANSNGDFIGSTNNEPLVFKTNNITRGMFTSAGNFQLSGLTGLGFRLLQSDSLGTLSSFSMGSVDDVLYGDGTWRPLPTPPPSTWELNGTSLFYLNGKVGIGTKTPFTNFDVIGDAYISNNLYVGGGIIITEKVNANVEVVTSTLRADSIVMDSTKGIYGYSIFKDRVKLENKLEVVGNTQINGNFRVNGDFIFGDNKRIGYLPPSGGNPEIITFGGLPLPPVADPCFFPNVPLTQLQGLIQSGGLNGTYVNVMTMGFDGANGIIEMEGSSTGVAPRLLINYNCGKDIFMNTGVKGGNVIMTSSPTLGKVGIGTDNPTAKLDVFGSLRLRNGSEGANKVLVSDADGVASWQDANTIEDGDWTINGTDIYRLTGNVGIGTDNPLGKFQVGDGFNKINIGFLSGDENSDCITSYLGFNAAKTTTGWVFNSNGTHNGGAVIMASNSGQLNFIIKRNPNGAGIGGECVLGTGTSDETLDNNQLLARTKMVIDPFGNVGIGTTIPAQTLEVKGTLRVGDGNTNFLDVWYDGAHNIIDAKGADLLINYYENKNCVIGPGSLTASGVFTAQQNAFFDANVGIGTTAVSGARLSVEGIIRARRVLVNNTWADYVFETNYQLMPLADLETYITTKKHLPNVPTAQDIEKDGVDLGEINKILVEKVEELTLYIISMNKRMVQLEAEMKQSKQK